MSTLPRSFMSQECSMRHTVSIFRVREPRLPTIERHGCLFVGCLLVYLLMCFFVGLVCLLFRVCAFVFACAGAYITACLYACFYVCFCLLVSLLVGLIVWLLGCV